MDRRPIFYEKSRRVLGERSKRKIFEPGRIGKLAIKNRIVMAAMSVGSLAEPDGRLSERIQGMHPDAVLIATGSTPTVPEIPGIKRENVLTCGSRNSLRRNS